METKKTILICPLDWGLGHATRCVPIIKELISSGFNVIIGADKNPLAFLKQEFPNIKSIVIPGYEIVYDKKGSSFKLFYESVKFFNFIKKEHSFIDKIIEENNIDVIISDNRYGLWSNKVKSIIITHQLYVRAPVGEKIAQKKIAQLIANFDECWIPDVKGSPNLSGDLSHLKSFNQPHKFIGVLSRFSKHFSPLGDPKCHTEPVEIEFRDIPKNEQTYEYDLIAILSGPEPQRTVFENIILEQIETHNLKAIVVRGLPSEEKEIRNKKQEIKVFNYLLTNELLGYILKSKVVVCRSGYSSIMDLAVLGKKAILVPTPGQTEQEYLAEYHLKQKSFYTQKQSELNLKKGIIEADKFISKKLCSNGNIVFFCKTIY